jgi:hypothetical protein
MSINIDDEWYNLINLIFSPEGPKKKCTIYLQFDEHPDVHDQPSLYYHIQMTLREIVLRGIKKLWNYDDILQLKEKEFYTLKEYFQAVGFDIELVADNTSMSPYDILKENENAIIEKISIIFKKI